MKEPKGSIITKLCTLVAFIVFIAGGMYIIYGGLSDDDMTQLAIGSGVFAIGLFLMGVLCSILMHYEKYVSLEGLSPLTCFKTGLMLMVFGSCIVFFGMPIMLWVDRGLWQLGIAGIVVFVIMIFVAIHISINFQTESSKKQVMQDPDATEHSGTVVDVIPHFPIILFFRTLYLFYEYKVEIDGAKSRFYLKRGSRMRKGLGINSAVSVKFNPRNPKYCVLLERNF